MKIPDLDSPGVPATVLIEDNQTEVFVEGESLGRWSLVDVRAERLVASAFSIDLDGEEITFLADEPTDFAYRGVDQMAKVWAKYKSMTLPRRMVATSRSRNGTKPSRIDDLRLAIQETLSSDPLNALSAPPQASTVIPTSHLPGVDEAVEPVEFKPSPAAAPRREPDPTPAPEARPAPEKAPIAVPEPTPTVEFESEPDTATAPEPEPEVAAIAEPKVEEEEIAPPEPVGDDSLPASKPGAARPADSVFKDSVPWAKGDDPVPAAKEGNGSQSDTPKVEAIDADSSDAPWYEAEPESVAPAPTDDVEPEVAAAAEVVEPEVAAAAEVVEPEVAAAAEVVEPPASR